MSNDKDDLTRIEDLSEFLHEDESSDQFETSDDSSTDETSVDFDLNNDATDPNIEFPEEFRAAEEITEVEDDSFGDDFESEVISADNELESTQDDESIFEPVQEENSGFDDEDSFEDTQDEIPDFTSNDSFEDTSDFSETEDLESDSDFSSGDSPSFEQNDELQEIKEPTQQLEQEISIEEVQEPETSPVEQVITTVTPQGKDEYKAPENFKELREFANTINFANTEHEGNPPFSIVISGLKYNEDLEDILILLSEFGITKDDVQRNAYQESLKRGSALIPRLSEYVAVTLCHKLRRFDINLTMGLTEKINPPKSYTSNDKGLTSKQSLYNSKSVHFEFAKEELRIEDIQLSTMSSISGHEILHQAGITNIQTTIDTKTLSEEVLNIFELESAMNELKLRAIKEKVNAVIGIQYQVVNSDKNQQTIIITGNLVWLKKF